MVTENWHHPKQLPGWKDRLLSFRREATLVRVNKPTRPVRARSLGYKAKQGVFVVRVKVKKGNRKRPSIAGGRRPKHSGQVYPLATSLQSLGEQKVARKYPNAEVLNSYWVAEDGTSTWYECILLDRVHPAVKKDTQLAPVTGQTKRALRGLTSSQKKSRGL